MSALLALAIATAVLVMIPGPNVALIVANSLKFGMRAGFATVLGTTAGVALQLSLVLFGMATVIEAAADALVWIKWAGVFYFAFLAVRSWREPVEGLDSVRASPAVFWRGCMLAAINPKTLLFNAAFIPQFVVANDSSATQILLLGGVFLVVVFLGDMLWAVFAHSAGNVLARFARFRSRVVGGMLAAAAIGLALSRR